MYTQKFLKGYNLVIRAEGGYSDDPDDPGNWTGGKKGEGELVGTKYGISAAQYPTVDIKGLRLTDAQEIYWRDYWHANGCEEMPLRIAIAYFDACVNQGPELATIALQRALGVKADGKRGPITMSAARGADQYHVAWKVLSERAWQYTGTKNFKKYGRGWFNRLFELSRDLEGIK